MILDPRERPEGCVTDLKFDAWFAGELSSAARSAVEDHLAACARCQARRAALDAERQAFLALRPHAAVPTRAAWPRRSRFALGGVLLSAAAAVALFLRVGAPEITRPVRIKGGPHIGFFVQRGDRSERGGSGHAVHPGDLIRFAYTSQRPAHLAIYGRDAAGAVSVYFPAGKSGQLMPEGYDAVLETDVVLDGVLGPETVFGLFCDADFALAETKAMFVAQRTLAPPHGCRIDALTWNKERAP